MKMNSEANEESERRKYKYRATAFLLGVAGISAVAGFSKTIYLAKKQDVNYFNKGITGSIHMADTGTQLAIRALGYGTIIAIVGVGSLSYAIWKLSGANDFNEFRLKMGEILPRIPRNSIPTSRTEFDGLNDLMQYLEEWKKN